MKRERKLRGNEGFTLIEIMIVLAIVGMLFSFVGVNVMKRYSQAKVDSAKIQIAAYEQALQAYYLDNNMYPHTSQGLQALITKPTVGRIPKNFADGGYFNKKALVDDPFGTPYRYECEDYQNYVIASNGPDGSPETEDDILSEE
ncbi:MAG: type II secretion system major pseudopilin GspG [Bdellovibrionaceae bacterium]|nr:type II secretion system major pseudopilin GspG [Pseudobdellovibrionaceae bacterium]